MNSDENFDTKDLGAEHLSVDCRRKIREQLQSEVEAFLAQGGKIQKVKNNISGNPPLKPDSPYTSHSI